MKSPEFDLPTAMKRLYGMLAAMGFEPRVSIQPSEWILDPSKPTVIGNRGEIYVRFAHYGGETHCTFRPEGKHDTQNEQHWRFVHGAPLPAFAAWQDRVAKQIHHTLWPGVDWAWERASYTTS